ncbi:TonB-dependent receptor [Coprobacter secundus]|uniref:TonB-dependent receptor n=1 Tax=Coprobacter secundus TaxID=1501392 RepID=UPI0022E24151|nr:TonB-dependent receptor [Coprobacter secundus]
MKTRLGVLLLFLLLSPIGYLSSQTVTINKTETVKKIIKEIEKRTGKSFVFHIDDVDLDRRVTINAKNQPLEKVLDNLFPKQHYRVEIKKDHIIVARKKKLLNLISGKIIDSQGQPLIGVSILSMEDEIGTVSDIDGHFSINANLGDELEFSYIGYQKQKVKVSKQTGIVITMQEDHQLLDEVVVIGYGSQKKANLTGAVGYIGGDKLEDRPVASLGQALQGAIPNMNISFGTGKPGETTNINIRGAGSINGNDSPLVLIDGVEGSIDNINPRDVESISVLKDASSAAIYGARAAFGVILVTTKSAEEGKVRITYNGRYSFSKQTTSTDFVTTGYDAAVMVDEFMRSHHGAKFTFYDSEDMEQLKARRYDVTEHPDRPWVVEKNGQYMYYGNFDWYDYLFDVSRPTWNHNISIMGGNKKVNYNVSGSYYNQRGIYRSEDYPDRHKDYNLRARLNAEVTSWLDFSFTSSLNAKKYYWSPGLNTGDNIAFCTFYALPFYVPKNPDGTNVLYTQVAPEGPAGGVHFMAREGKSFGNNKQKTFLNTANIALKLYKGLTLNANYSYRYYNQDMVTRTVVGQYSRVPGKVEIADNDLFKNKLRQTIHTDYLHTVDVFANYENSFGGHHIRAVVGANYESYYRKRIYATKLNIQSDVLNDFNLGDNTKVTLGGENDAGQREYALLGFFGRLGYDYKGKYLAEFNIRRDATSRFPRKDRAGWFPSVSLGWRASEESFFESVKGVISNLKIRGSYGVLGNQKIDEYYPYVQTMKVFPMDNYILDGGIASYTSSGNPLSGSLTWESVYSTNIGLDLGFFNGRLSFTGDIYRRDTKGMLMPGVKLPGVYGATEPKENGAELRTKGFEFTLGWNDDINILGKKFNYYAAISLADNQTKVTKYTQNPNKQLNQCYEGMEWGELWGYQIDGLFPTDEAAQEYSSRIDQTLVSQNIFVEAQGEYRGLQAGDMSYADLDGSGCIDNGLNTLDNHGDLKKVGNKLPRYTYSGNVGFSWYGVDFSAFFQGIGRQHIYPGGDCMLFWGGYARPYASFIPKDFSKDIWTPENPTGYYPKLRGYSAQGNRSLAQPNDRYLQNLAYCRLKNVTLGYTLPNEWTKKIYVDRLRIYFSGDNLATWTKLHSDYIDPEQFAKDGNARVYPFPKTFSFGIDITL